MSLTIAVQKSKYFNGFGFKAKDVKITFDSTYPSGGWPVTAANVGLTSIDHVILPGTCYGYAIEWDYTNGKIVGYASAGTVMTGSGNLNAQVIRAIFLGVGV